jgi:hypothetical protein
MELKQKEKESLPPLLDVVVAEHKLSGCLRRWERGEEAEISEEQITNWKEQISFCCNLVLRIAEEAQEIQIRHRVSALLHYNITTARDKMFHVVCELSVRNRFIQRHLCFLSMLKIMFTCRCVFQPYTWW